MTVTNKENYEEHFEKIIDALADSVLDLSAEEIRAETPESGGDPQEVAERTGAVLLMVVLNKRLADLGHWVNEKYWQYDEQGYHNICLTCGLSVSFTPASNEVKGDSLRANAKTNNVQLSTSGKYLVGSRRASTAEVNIREHSSDLNEIRGDVN